MMSNTNDTPGKYGEQPKREPLLALEQINDWSDEFMDGIRLPNGPNLGEIKDAFITGADKVDGFYRTLITEGRLMVVKTAGIDAEGNCTECGWDADHCYPFSKFCPGCGARIVEA